MNFFLKADIFSTCVPYIFLKSFLWLKVDTCIYMYAYMYMHFYICFFLNIIPLYVFHLVFVRHMILNLHFQEMVFFSVFFFQNVSVVYFTFKLYVYLFSGESKERPRLVKRRMVYKGCFVTFTTYMYWNALFYITFNNLYNNQSILDSFSS